MRKSLLIGLLLLGGVAHAQTTPDPVAELLSLDKTRLKQLVAELISSRSDVFDLNYVEPDDDQQGGFALTYKWDIEKSQSELGPQNGRYKLNSLTYDLAIEGTYAFDDAMNNRDLSTAIAAVRLQRADFGQLRRVDGVSYQKCLAGIAEPTDINDNEGIARADAQQDECVRKHGVVVKSNDGAYYYALDFHGGIEGNQDYSQRNGVFGLAAVYASEPTADTAKYNIFDLPFRALRSAFGNGREFVAPLPSIRMTLDRLQPDGDDPRTLLAGDDNFNRASAEAAFQTQVASVNGHAVRFNISYRYFYELSPPTAVEAAGLDRFGYTRASLRFPAQLLPLFASDSYEIFIGYTKGQLPFDLQSDEALELGITSNLAWLGQLLSQ